MWAISLILGVVAGGLLLLLLFGMAKIVEMQARILAWAVEVESRRSPRVRRRPSKRAERLAAWCSRVAPERRPGRDPRSDRR